MAPAVDRRVRKTRKQLRDALVSLTLERGWDAVRVLDVCAHADIGRSTFYVHFADKEELLLSGFDTLHEALVPTASPAGSFGFVRPLFEHAKENTRLMRAVAGRKSGQAVQRRFRDVTQQLVEQQLASRGVSAGLRVDTARFLSGALVELLVGWLEAPRAQPPDAVAELFLRLAEGALRELR